MVGGRWVRDQEAHIVRLSDDIVKVSWDEPTGTTVSVSVDFAARRLHGVIFFSRWIAQNPGDDFVYVARVRNGFTSPVCRQNLLDKLAIDLREDLVHLG
jgi:phenolic acid decarboxylase